MPKILAGVRAELADEVPERVAVVEATPRKALTKVNGRAVAEIGAEQGEAV